MYKNEEWLDKAKSLFPKLIETNVAAQRAVTLTKEAEKIHVTEAEDFRNKELRKQDRIVLDFGNHQVGYLKLKLTSRGSHPDAPVLLRLHFAEQPIELFENPKEYKGWICSSWIEEEMMHIDVLPTEFEIKRRYAFRYVEIEVVDISSKFSLVVEEAICKAVSSADDSKLLIYEPVDIKRKRIDEIAVRTLHNCMQTVFEDGPKRDRRLWMGDLRMQALANYETYQMNDMVKACLYLFAGLPMENGQIGACVFLEPEFEVDDTVMFDYSLLFIATLRDYYEKTKDIATVQELWHVCLKQIAIALERFDQNLLVRDSNQLGWCFVDWNLNLNKQASAQGIFLYTVRAAIMLAQVLEDKEQEDYLQGIYDKAKQAACQYLWDSDVKCFVSGGDKQISVASQVWLILGQALEVSDARNLLERLPRMEHVEGMVTPYMYHNYIDALMYVGQEKEALDEMLTYWGGMADLGADTFFELYNPLNPNESPYGGTIVNSYCHAWSCAPAYFLRKFFK